MTKGRILLILCVVWTIGFTLWFSGVYCPGRWSHYRSYDLDTISIGVLLGYSSFLLIPMFMKAWRIFK